jgi:putative RNA 2'-phosphotransferase
MDYTALSKEVSYALRHAPEKYGLTLDDEGWTDISTLLSSLSKDKRWSGVRQEDLEAMIETSVKKRHQIAGGRIRAYYGHSIQQEVVKEAQTPPEHLYHGTTNMAIPKIRVEGLNKQERQYVHLSEDIETAVETAMRRDKNPVLLRVHAGKASRSGIRFYPGNDTIWLSDAIPAEFLEEVPRS